MRVLKFSKLLLKYFGLEEDVIYNFGGHTKAGALMARIPVLPYWHKLPLLKKMQAIARRKWEVSTENLDSDAREIFLREVFGKEDDFGITLYNINLLHHYRDWNFDYLTEDDLSRVDGLRSLRLLLSVKNWEVTSDFLHLGLWKLFPVMCLNLVPISYCIPVSSIRYCLEIQENYAFNSIRASKHPIAGDIICYLYEILNIQHKTANAFYNLVVLMAKLDEKKENAAMMSYEVDAITICDSIINYLKSTIEKAIVLLGLIFEIKNLDSYRRHQQKLSALEKQVPEKVKKKPYYIFIWSQIQSATLAGLNDLRSGINHKKGVSKLQPHRFVNKSFKESGLWEQF